MKIPFNRTYISPSVNDHFSDLLKSGEKQSGEGRFNQKCTDWLQRYLGCPVAYLTPSCTASMEFAYLLIDLQPGDEVIMPSFTFSSTATAVSLFGAVPVFVDVDDYLNLDLTQLEQAFTAKTKAVCAVHYAGQSCDMVSLQKWCKTKGVFLIEDAAQALMATFQKKPLGTFGDLAAFSFHETKNIICGEGGALIINNTTLIERAEIIRQKGTNRQKFLRGEVDKYTWQDKGSSYLLAETAACLLYTQLLEAESITIKRQRIIQRYLEKINKSPYFQLMNINPDNTHNGHIFYLVTTEEIWLEKIQGHLKQFGVQAVTHYVSLHDSPAGKKLSRHSGHLKHCENISKKLLRLPVYFELSPEQQDYIIKVLNDFKP